MPEFTPDFPDETPNPSHPTTRKPAPKRDETPNPSHPTTRDRAAGARWIPGSIAPDRAWAGCWGAMDARIHRTGWLIMEKLGLSRMGTWQQQTKPSCPGPPPAQPRRNSPDQTTAYFRQALLRATGGALRSCGRPGVHDCPG